MKYHFKTHMILYKITFSNLVKLNSFLLTISTDHLLKTLSLNNFQKA